MERHLRDTWDDGTVTLCTLARRHCTVTRWSRRLWSSLNKEGDVSRDSPGAGAPFRTNIIPLTGVWSPPRTWVKPGRFGSFFVLCFLVLEAHCLQMLCLPGFGTHANTQNLPHFRAFPASIQEHSPPKCRFSWQALNCQIVPGLPSYNPPLPIPPLKKSPN